MSGTSTAVRDHPARAPHGGWRLWASVAALGAGSFAIATDTFVVAGILGGISGDFGVTIGTAGLTVTAFALPYAVGAVVLTAVLPARSPRRLLIGSLLVFALCNVAAAVAPTFLTLLAGRTASALAAAVFVPAAGAAAVAAAPKSHRGRALGVVLAGTSAATVLGAPLGVVAAGAFSWRAAFWLIAALAAAALAGVALTGAGAGPVGVTSLRERLSPLRSPAVVGTLAVSFLAMTASKSVYTYLPLVAGVAAGAHGLLISALGVGGVAGTWWGGAAADRYGGRRVALVAVAGLIVCFAVLPAAVASLATALAVMLAWGAGTWGLVPAQQHRLIELAPGPVSFVLALNSSANNLGFSAGALFGGLLVDAVGPGPLWLLAAGCCAAALILHAFLSRKASSS